jgi:hypothetical protein
MVVLPFSINRNGKGVDLVIFGVSAEELDERDLVPEVEGDDHPVIAPRHLKPRTLAIEDHRAGRRP